MFGLSLFIRRLVLLAFIFPQLGFVHCPNLEVPDPDGHALFGAEIEPEVV